METENVRANGPGQPFIFWDDEGSHNQIASRIEDNGPLNAFIRDGSNNWKYLRLYEVGWRGFTTPGELDGFLSADVDRRNEWSQMLEVRQENKYEALLQECGLTDLSDPENGRSLAAQLERPGSGVVLEFSVMKPVGFNMAHVKRWVNQRRGIFT